jgi:dimeric dUTPase (all-alpha-NTP-PPase superfamily)
MTNAIKQYDFTLEEVTKLFQMQDTLNSYIHPEWKTQGFNWGLAIVDECMEIHGHLGWKWWKKDYQVGLHEGNRKQVQLEVIDILHFIVSDWHVQGWEQYALENLNYTCQVYPIDYCLKHMQRDIGNERIDTTFNIWINLAHGTGLTKSQILETYTQKYVLNKFRQDHGYKTGEYCKEWQLPTSIHNGAPENWEDNEVLEHLVRQLQQGNHSTTDENLLYAELESLYNSRLNQ